MGWGRPFEQQYLVNCLRFLSLSLSPSLVDPCRQSSLWEARVEAEGQVRAVDCCAHGCPVHFYLHDEKDGDTTACGARSDHTMASGVLWKLA